MKAVLLVLSAFVMLSYCCHGAEAECFAGDGAVDETVEKLASILKLDDPFTKEVTTGARGIFMRCIWRKKKLMEKGLLVGTPVQLNLNLDDLMDVCQKAVLHTVNEIITSQKQELQE